MQGFRAESYALGLASEGRRRAVGGASTGMTKGSVFREALVGFFSASLICLSPRPLFFFSLLSFL